MDLKGDTYDCELAIAMRERWSRCWRRLDADVPDRLFDALLLRYSEPHRSYHTLDHILVCLGHLDNAAPQAEHIAEVEFALWFHDAIYDTRAVDNEDRSAKWAHDVLLHAKVPSETARRVNDLILVTKHDGAAQTDDQALMLDIDLSILGAAQAPFDTYEQQIRREYEWVDDQEFRTTRSGILKAFLERPAVYLTRYFNARLEANARRNLARSLEMLSS